MPDKKLTDLTQRTAIDGSDLIYVVDVSTNTSHSISYDTFVNTRLEAVETITSTVDTISADLELNKLTVQQVLTAISELNTVQDRYFDFIFNPGSITVASGALYNTTFTLDSVSAIFTELKEFDTTAAVAITLSATGGLSGLDINAYVTAPSAFEMYIRNNNASSITIPASTSWVAVLTIPTL
jgi:hypothetical protein